MKNLNLLFTALLLLCCVGMAKAHYFEAGGIYYNILSSEDKTVAVTFKGISRHEYSNEYTGSVVIPESVTYKGTTYSVTSIGEEAFYCCSSLTSITIPNSVTSIGGSAFHSCTGLASITIPNSVTSIGKSAFSSCTGLTSITIPNSVTSIGEEAFQFCTGLTSIEIPNSITSIGDYAFSYCRGLTSVVIPNSVTSIGNYAFKNCTGLTSITIPNSITSIGDYAFSYCRGLTSVVIPNSVTSIGDYAFEDCRGLTSVEFNAENCTRMGSLSYPVFSGCTALSAVTIGENVKNIPDYAFYGCKGLKTVYNFSNLTFSKGSSSNGYIAYYANKVHYIPEGFIENGFVLGEVDGVNTLAGYLGNTTKITLPADYKGENYVIGNEAFSYCTWLTSITIPNSVTSIGDYAFFDCTGLTSITIPNGVTSIGNYAFEGCSNIETLYISSTTESIGIKAFYGCDKIKEIKVGAEKPIRVDENIFTDAVYDNATLYIPKGTKSLYEKREPWNTFFYIVEMDYTGIENVKAESGEVQTIYDLNGRAVENPTKGVYIIDGKKVLVK